MTSANTHFEDIWCSAEKVSSKQQSEKSTADILKSITVCLDAYWELGSSSLPEEIKTSLRARQMGEIVFLLTAISERDNVNVWVALENELKLNV
jgi:hypothetical protein